MVEIEKFCTSMCCSGDHRLIYKEHSLSAHFNVSYFDMKKILKCYNIERIQICNLCKKCSSCKDFVFS